MTEEFAQALADCAAENAVDLTDLRGKCLAAIAAGGGQITFLLTAGLNGKAGSQECKMDAAELLIGVNRAVQIAAGTAVTLTYVDLS